ncbi:hypothetical protein KVT40_002656 [Elsinoe batatas]|uniref:Uncharacterized protein n=1 Tax=Elsinoe batatas TaxID=2601811 RepID=A0A8K0L6T8_9PEZI|nr:hypothetical protein KVT40_002656 [Elsinoe batatas]
MIHKEKPFDEQHFWQNGRKGETELIAIPNEEFTIVLKLAKDFKFEKERVCVSVWVDGQSIVTDWCDEDEELPYSCPTRAASAVGQVGKIRVDAGHVSLRRVKHAKSRVTHHEEVLRQVKPEEEIVLPPEVDDHNNLRIYDETQHKKANPLKYCTQVDEEVRDAGHPQEVTPPSHTGHEDIGTNDCAQHVCGPPPTNHRGHDTHCATDTSDDDVEYLRSTIKIPETIVLDEDDPPLTTDPTSVAIVSLLDEEEEESSEEDDSEEDEADRDERIDKENESDSMNPHLGTPNSAELPADETMTGINDTAIMPGPQHVQASSPARQLTDNTSFVGDESDRNGHTRLTSSDTHVIDQEHNGAVLGLDGSTDPLDDDEGDKTGFSGFGDDSGSFNGFGDDDMVDSTQEEEACPATRDSAEQAPDSITAEPVQGMEVTDDHNMEEVADAANASQLEQDLIVNRDLSHAEEHQRAFSSVWNTVEHRVRQCVKQQDDVLTIKGDLDTTLAHNASLADEKRRGVKRERDEDGMDDDQASAMLRDGSPGHAKYQQRFASSNDAREAEDGFLARVINLKYDDSDGYSDF